MLKILSKLRNLYNTLSYDPSAEMEANKKRWEARLEVNEYWLEITGEKANWYKSELIALIKSYNVYPEYQLLPIETIENFTNDLEKLGIAFEGFDGWKAVKCSPLQCLGFREQAKTSKYHQGPMVKYEPDGTCYHLAETTYSFFVGENILFGEHPVSESIQAIKDCIANRLPDPKLADIVYAAIALHVPSDWHDELFYGR